MLPRMLLFILILGVSLPVDMSAVWPPRNSPGEVDITGFESKMNDAVQKAENDVRALQAQATRRDMAPTWNTKLELENAIIQLDVKKTLVNNFKGTESLKSQLVQNKLLQVLNKPLITTADLADLQSLVLQEKNKMKMENPPQEPVKQEPVQINRP